MAVLEYSDVLSVGPTVEPVSVAEAKRNSDVDDSYRDADFSRWITEARKQVEHDARISLVNQTRIRTMDRFPAERFIEVRKPLVSVSSVQYIDTSGDTQTLASSKYEEDTSRAAIWLAYSESWPGVRDIQNAVTVTYVSGYGAAADNVPEAARQAILLLVKHKYENPDISADAYNDDSTYRAVVSQIVEASYP